MRDNHLIDSAEAERLRRLAQYEISRTPPEAAFDDIARLAADLFGAPVAYLCITEADCHWFKAKVGIDLAEVPRAISFCDHTMQGKDVMAVADASLDPRFADNPLVTGPYHVRFYAGFTLRDGDGFALGTLAVVDVVPRQITAQQKDFLKRLAGIALDRMELRKVKAALRQTVAVTEAARLEAVADRAELRQVIECLPQAILLLDEQNRFILWNKNYEKMFPDMAEHFAPGESLETIHRVFLRKGLHRLKMSLEEQEEWLENRMERLNQAGTIYEESRADGRLIRCDQHPTPDGNKVYVRTDITDDRNAAESFRLLFESNPVPMWVVERSSLKFIDVNAAAVEHYGYTREQFLNMTSLDIRPENERQRALDDARNNFSTDSGGADWTHLKADGSEILVSSYARPIKYNGADAAIISVIDVTERRKHDAHIQYLVEHDALTGLPNRRLFFELLEGSAVRKTQNHYFTAIILIDVDDFKNVNDTLGHQVGDHLIVAVATRLEECIGDRGVVARLGGDEFVVLLSRLSDPQAAHAAGIDVIDAFRNPLKLPKHEILVKVSAGISLGVDASVDASALMLHADLALYQAKSGGGDICAVYEPRMSLQIMLRREIEQDLRQALARNQLVIHYQPQVDLAGGTETGFEALLHWNHPGKGMIAASDFIPIAEASGLIIPIGTWVLEQSCLVAATWQENLSIAVNVSPAQFKSGKLVAAVAGALLKSGLAAYRLELEITESILLEKSAETLDILKNLKDLGVSIALDDFGTGYSGLGYLNNYPIDTIKIDQSFIREIGIKSKALELVRAAVRIGQSLGLKTLAEGIETTEQLRILQTLGCQQGQGFLFSPAIAADRIAGRLKLKSSLPSKRLTA